MHRLGVPTRDEIHRLTRKVEELNAKIERLHTPPPAAPKGAAKPKAPAKPKGTGKAGGTV
jgi:hypothetical protein